MAGDLLGQPGVPLTDGFWAHGARLPRRTDSSSSDSAVSVRRCGSYHEVHVRRGDHPGTALGTAATKERSVHAERSSDGRSSPRLVLRSASPGLREPGQIRQPRVDQPRVAGHAVEGGTCSAAGVSAPAYFVPIRCSGSSEIAARARAASRGLVLATAVLRPSLSGPPTTTSTAENLALVDGAGRDEADRPRSGDGEPGGMSGQSRIDGPANGERSCRRVPQLGREVGRAPRRRARAGSDRPHARSPARGGSTNASPSSRQGESRAGPSPGSAPASPQVGVGTARWARRERSKPSRSARSKAVRASARAGRAPAVRAEVGRSRRRRGLAAGSAARRRGPRAPARAAAACPRPTPRRTRRARPGDGGAPGRPTAGRVDADRDGTDRSRARPAAAGRRSSAPPPARRPRRRGAQARPRPRRRHRADRPVARRRGQRAGQHRGQARLVELDEHARPRCAPPPRRRGRGGPRRGWRRTRGRRRGR